MGGVAVDSLGPDPGIDFDQGASANTLTGAGTLAAAGAATVVCNTGNSVNAGDVSRSQHDRRAGVLGGRRLTAPAVSDNRGSRKARKLRAFRGPHGARTFSSRPL